VTILREASVRAFVHATESEEKVREILLNLLPEGTRITSTRLRGHFGNPIITLGADLLQEGQALELWRRIYAGLSGVQNLVQELGRRMEGSSLYLRLDKQVAAEGRIVLTEGGDAIHIRLRLGGSPSQSPEERIRLLVLEAQKEIRGSTV
jgi:RNA binding exosome subunit